MRKPSLLTSTLAMIVAASPSFASFPSGSTGQVPQPPPSTSAVAPVDAQPEVRQEAARYYGDGYNLVMKARQEIADGKTKNVEKRFRKALEKGERAVEIDSTYHEAWNLVGYCARSVKDYDRSLVAYKRCLAIKPDFAAAHEYLGETYVETGDTARAREQLAWLEEAEAEEEASRLKTAIEAWEKVHPLAGTAQTAPANGASAPGAAAAPLTSAPADTTATTPEAPPR